MFVITTFAGLATMTATAAVAESLSFVLSAGLYGEIKMSSHKPHIARTHTLVQLNSMCASLLFAYIVVVVLYFICCAFAHVSERLHCFVLYYCNLSSDCVC